MPGPLSAPCGGATTFVSLSSVPDSKFLFKRSVFLSGPRSRGLLWFRNSFLPVSRTYQLFQRRGRSTCATASVESDESIENSLFLHSLDADKPSSVGTGSRTEGEGQSLAHTHFGQDEELEGRLQIQRSEATSTSGDAGIVSENVTHPSEKSVAEEQYVWSSEGVIPIPDQVLSQENSGDETVVSCGRREKLLVGRRRYLTGENDYQRWMPENSQRVVASNQNLGELNQFVSEEDRDQLSNINASKAELHRRSVDETFLEHGNDEVNEIELAEGTSVAVKQTGQDVLVEFLQSRSKYWDNNTQGERQKTKHSVFEKKQIEMSPKQPPVQRSTAEEDVDHEAFPQTVDSAGSLDPPAKLTRTQPQSTTNEGDTSRGLLPGVQGRSVSAENGFEPGGWTERVVNIALSLPQNSSLEDFLKPFHGKITTRAGNQVLKALGTGQLTWSLLSFFQWMRLHDPCLLDSRSFCTVFTYLGKVGMVDRALLLYKNMPSGRQFEAVEVYNSLLAALARCGRADTITSLLEEMEAKKIDRDAVTYSILMTATKKDKNRLEKVWSMFDDMLGNGVIPSVTAFGSLIKAFCDEGYHKQALVIVMSMEKMGISPNVIIYNTLIDAHGRASQLEEAEGLLLEMKQRGLHPTESTYNALVNGYAKNGQCEVAEELVLEMQEQGLRPDVFTYTSLISAFGKQKRTEDAVNVYLRMRKNGVPPSSHTYTALINAYAEGGWSHKAERALEDMKREGLQPTVETYTALLDGYRQTGNVDMVLQVWNMMKESGFELTRVTYITVMDAFAKQGQFNEVREVMTDFMNHGFESDTLIYNMLINAYARGGLQSKLPKTLMEMRTAGCQPDSFTYCTLIYASLRFRDFTSAFEYDREMNEKGLRPDPKTYSKMKHILNAKLAEKEENDRKAALGQLRKKLKQQARKNPQRAKQNFKQNSGYQTPRSQRKGPNKRITEIEKALWKSKDSHQKESSVT